MLKLSQAKYLLRQPLQEKSQIESEKIDNLTISNKLKGVLALNFDKASNTITVVENVWKKSVSEF
jgi:hypothetical protein